MMIRSLWTGATGMNAMQTFIDAIGHDLTNVNTNGYKKRHLNFQDLFYQTERASGLQGAEEGVNIPVGIEVGNGVRLAATTPVFTQGNAMQTNVWSNMMLTDYDSFFRVTMADGTQAYTRDGSFLVDSEGRLRTADGLALDPDPGQIPEDARNPSITLDGRVQYIDVEGNTQTVGQINLYRFVNPAGLRPYGNNLWQRTESSGDEQEGQPGQQGYGEVRGGWVEGSNVDAVTEMVNMISAQRAYEFNSKTIQTADSMLQTVTTLKRS